MRDRTWPRHVLAEVLGSAAEECRRIPASARWRVQVDGVAQASCTLQVALAARMAGCGWHSVAMVLNRHELFRLVNPTGGVWEPWDRWTLAQAVMRVPREPGLAHVLGWFAAQFLEGDLLEAVWVISAMDGGEHTSLRDFTEVNAVRGMERALGVARAAARAPGGERPKRRLDPLDRDFRAQSAEIARSCWYFLFGPGARGRLGYEKVLVDAFRPVAADAVSAAGLAALEEALTERAAEVDVKEREARERAVMEARLVDRGKR